MSITPQQFAKLLKQSTLEAGEQEEILKILPKLTMAQIQELANILKEDVKQQEKSLDEAKGKQDQAILKMNVELQKILLKRPSQ